MAKRFGNDPERKKEALGSEAPQAAGAAEETAKPVAQEQPKEKVVMAVKSAPKPVAGSAPQAPPEEPKAYVRLEVFCRLAGMKLDRAAGFKHWATKKKLGPLTVAEWREQLNAFQNRPVG